MGLSIKRRQVALLSLFVLNGLVMGSWVTRTPAIRDLLDASTAEMGLVLFGMSIGSFLGISSSGTLVGRFGAKKVVAISFSFLVLSLPTIGVGALVSSKLIVAIGLFFYGIGSGAGDVGMNVEGSQVEKETGHIFLTYLHGGYSLGVLGGAIFGMIATTTAFPVVWHLLIATGFGVAILATSIPVLPAATGKVSRKDPLSQESTLSKDRPVWKDNRVLIIGVIVFALALAEGTANDWLPLLMIDGHGFSPSLGTVIFTVFAAGMTTGRFIGGPIVERFGRTETIAVCSVLVACGLALIAFIDNQTVAGVSVILWGLGASLGFPLCISAAGDSGDNSALRVGIVSIIGYLAFLTGPPILGFLGQHYGLRNALLVPMVFVIIAVFLSPALEARKIMRKSGPLSAHK